MPERMATWTLLPCKQFPALCHRNGAFLQWRIGPPVAKATTLSLHGLHRSAGAFPGAQHPDRMTSPPGSARWKM